MGIKLTRGRLAAARARLVKKYLVGGTSWVASRAPKLTPVERGDRVIGAVADAKAAHLLAAIAALESEQLQKHYEPLYDARVAALGPTHVPLINAFTRDLFPLNKR